MYHNLTEDAQFDLREQTDEKIASKQVVHVDEDAFMIGDDTGCYVVLALKIHPLGC